MAKTTIPAAPTSPTVAVRTVDADTARRWLGENTNNRSVSKTAVARYARDMKAGEWLYTGDPVRFSADGRLLDGQHRLHAIIEAGVAVPMLVIEGLPDETQTVMDTGRKRATADALALIGETNTVTLAAVARIIHLDGALDTRHDPTTSELLDLIESDPSIRPAAHAGHAMRAQVPGVPPATIGYVYWRLARIDTAATARFFDRLTTLADLSAGSPVLALHKRLVATVGAGRRGDRERRREHLAWFFAAWNAERRGQSRTIIRSATNRDGALVVPDPV